MTALERDSTARDISGAKPVSTVERVAVLEERSLHAATQAQLYKAALALFVSIVGTLGGLIIHLHNQQTALIERLLTQ